MRIGILMVLYLLEIIKYYLAYGVCYGGKKIKYQIPLVGAVICFFIILFGKTIDDTLVYIFFLVLVAMFFGINGEKRFSKWLLLVFILNSLDEAVSIIEQALVWGTGSSGMRNAVEQFWECLTVVLILLIADIVKRRLSLRQKGKIGKFIKQNIFTVAILMAVCMLFTVGELEYMKDVMPEDVHFQKAAFVLCLMSYIGIGVAVFFAIYIKTVNEQMSQMVEHEKLLKEMQKHYYEELLGKEEDTRRYRHDLNNHLICLQNYALNCETEKVSEYIEKMQNAAVEIQKRCYFTGNEIVDAITNYYVPQLEEDIMVKVSGSIELDLDELRLCTIYANLLKNAIEELEREKGENRFLYIKFSQGKRYVQILIENSLSDAQRKQELKAILKSKKKDKSNHGMGLLNVKRAVEEMGGMLEVRKSEKSFLTEVNLPVGNDRLSD